VRRYARAAAIALILGMVLAALLVATFVHRPQAPAAALAGPVTVNRALSSTAIAFGDAVTAEIDVISRDAEVPAGSVRVATSFAPLTVVSTKVDRARVGGASLLRTRATLQCVKRGCLPPDGGRSVAFAPIVVSYTNAGGTARVELPWSRLHVASRVEHGTVAIGALDTAPPLDPGFTRSPRTVRLALLVATVLLALGGAALVVSALWPASLRRSRWARLSPLECSLLLVEEAARSDSETERRRTLDQLALRLGDAQATQLELRARALAWGETPPESRNLTLLTADVRSSLNGKVRG
jgi:hypothetical protein